jgi:hypothetical protein
MQASIVIGERAGHFTSTVREQTLYRSVHLAWTTPAARTPFVVVVLVSSPMALHQPIGSPVDNRRRFDASPRLIGADAALILVERWRNELAVLRRRSPTSDAVRTLADCVDELSAAITAGQELTIQLTVVEAHQLSHIPVSTLRWLCNHKAELVGARKREGIWYVDRVLFERYLISPEGLAAAARHVVEPASLTADVVIPLARESREDLEAALQ